MSGDLVLQSLCTCGATEELYETSCTHMTLCLTCAKCVVENQGECKCGVPITRLFREYKNNPWLLKNESGQIQYQGVLEGPQSSKYYLLVQQKKEFVAIPTESWYNFKKIEEHPQCTLEQAEEMMKNRSKMAVGHKRLMMKGCKMNAGVEGEEEDSTREDAMMMKKVQEEVILIRMMTMTLRKVMIGSIRKFTDDDEAVGNASEDHEDLASEISPDSKRAMKKLLDRGMHESDSEEDDDDNNPVTEGEIRAVLMQKTPVTTKDLSGRFKSRLK